MLDFKPSSFVKYPIAFAALLLLFGCTRPTAPSPPRTYDELVQILKFSIEHKNAQTFFDQFQDSPRTIPENLKLIDFLAQNDTQIYVTDIYPFWKNKHVLYPKAEKFVWLISSNGNPEKIGVSTLTISTFAYTKNSIVKIRSEDPETDTSNKTNYKFTLVVKDRSKLLKNLGKPYPHTYGDSWDGHDFKGTSMGELANILSTYTGFRVTDETGISGDYDFNPHIRDINNPAITRIALQSFGLDLILAPSN